MLLLYSWVSVTNAKPPSFLLHYRRFSRYLAPLSTSTFSLGSLPLISPFIFQLLKITQKLIRIILPLIPSFLYLLISTAGWHCQFSLSLSLSLLFSLSGASATQPSTTAAKKTHSNIFFFNLLLIPPLLMLLRVRRI